MSSGATATAAVKSVLDKPLHELTENDISQLTREDCRRYLKEKGMRRPSWNKSQAIQQVISLKSLLEPSPPKPPPPSTPTPLASNSSCSVKEACPIDNGGSMSELAEGGVPNGSAGPSSLDAARERECGTDSSHKAISIRRTDAPHLPIGQMTIFYSGKVSVYDEVPSDKQAKTIMHLGAGPIQLCQDELSGRKSTCWSTPCRLCTSNVKFNVAAKDVTIVQSAMTDAEGHTNRQLSLHRYFEKRKDRGKFKMKRKTGSCASGLEMYVDHQMREPAINGQRTNCKSNSTCQLRIPGLVHGLIDKQPKNLGWSVDLNDKGCCCLCWCMIRTNGRRSTCCAAAAVCSCCLLLLVQ